ncbi:MAG: hypothetical protein H6832_04655 [Planctomycetes bacterium]|nr:hypothetical protein [Planctomycetota bacterium]MCB9917671.1 hypothetical protein [Planctomycetota bacterium]
MKRLLPITSALLLTSALSAQTLTGKTATDFGNEVKAGTSSDANAAKKDTAIDAKGVFVNSMIMGAGHAGSAATIRKLDDRLHRTTTWTASVSDRGNLGSRDSNNDSSANTTGDGGAAGAHGCDFVFAADTDTKGKLTIHVSAGASTGGSATARVKIGDKTYAVKAGDKPMLVSVDVTLTKAGLTASVVTSGACALKGAGFASYGATATVSFTGEPASGGKCTVTDGAKGCGPTLKGTASAGSGFFGPSVKLELSGADKNAIGLLLYSPDGKTLDIGGCPLFSTIAHAAAFITDDTGAATHTLRFPAGRDITISVGEVILSFTTSGVTFKATNTLDIVCTK